jgi:Carboxypeptidase regulatory-like domain/TonB dependent receptor
MGYLTGKRKSEFSRGEGTVSPFLRPARTLCLLSFLLILPSYAPAQLYTGSIAGTVTDPSGALISGAHVTAVDQDKGFSFPATTESNGRYVVRLLPPGRYAVSVEAAGFRSERKEGISIEVNQNVGVDFALKVGASTQIVDVQAGGVELQTQDAVTGQVVDRRFINDLPLIDRDFADLTFLAPGVTEVDTQCPGCMVNNFISNGSRNATSDILLDGVSATNFEQNSGILSPTYLPSVDAVEEFKVQQSNFSAEYGFSGATLVNVVTRSGTNSFHGSVYDFFRNQILDANDWFNNLNGQPRPGLQRNNFGGTIGGPLKKNKAFFFFDYDGSRENDFHSDSFTVPTPNERKGDFGEVCMLIGASFDGSGRCSDPNGQLYDPYSADPTQSVPLRSRIIPFNNLATYKSPGSPALAGTPFQPAPVAGNLIDPVALKLLQLFPLPTKATTGVGGPSNWFGSGSTPFSNNQFDVKVDYRFSDANLLSTKYSQQWGVSQSFNCFKNEADPCNGGPTDSTAHLVAINDTHTLSPTLVLNVSYGYTRGWNFEKGITGYFPALDPVKDLGLPSYFDISGYKQLPAVNITGYNTTSPGGNNNIGTQTFSYLLEGTDTHQLVGSLSWVRGLHELKFGGEWRAHRINFRQPGWPGGQGTFDFSGSSQNIGVDANGNSTSFTGGDGMASFVMGIGSMLSPGTCSCTYEVPNAVSTQSFQLGGFVQDNYRLSSKLTVNLGLRYELNLPRTERFNRMNWLDPKARNPLNGGSITYQDPITLQTVTRPLLGAEIFASPSDRYNYATDYSNLQPRFGVAYQLAHTLVLRGGYGIYYSTPRSGAAGTGPWGYQGYDAQTNWIPSFDGQGILPGARFSDPYRSYGTGFPDIGPRVPAANSLGPLNDIGFAAVGPIKSVSHNTPYEQAWSFGAQKELPFKIVAEADYVGKKGTHLYFGGFREHNFLGPQFDKQLTTNPGFAQGLATNAVPNPFFGIITDPNSVLSAQTIAPYRLLVPFPEFDGFQGDSPPIATSIYHAAQFRVEKGFSNGLQFLMTYAVSKSIDSSSTTDDSISWLGGGVNSGTLAVQDPNNLKPERAVSTWDIPQVLQFTYVYALPIGRGKHFGGGMNKVLNAVVGGWQTSGILRFDNGRPIIPFLNSPVPVYPSLGQRPNLNGILKRSGGSLEDAIDKTGVNPSAPPPGSYFANAAVSQSCGCGVGALSLPPPYTIGTAPRTITSVRQPGTRNTTLSLAKQFQVSEGRRLEYRLEAFNAFNHPHFNGPDSGVDSPTFGQISSTVSNSQRQVQMALKFYW